MAGRAVASFIEGLPPDWAVEGLGLGLVVVGRADELVWREESLPWLPVAWAALFLMSLRGAGVELTG